MIFSLLISISLQISHIDNYDTYNSYEPTSTNPHVILKCINSSRKSPLVVNNKLTKLASWINYCNSIKGETNEIDIYGMSLPDRCKNVGLDQEKFEVKETYFMYRYRTEQDWIWFGEESDIFNATWIGLDVRQGKNGLLYACITTMRSKNKDLI